MTLVILAMCFGFVPAQAASRTVLTGRVTSQAEGAMEGVAVIAQRDGSGILTSVVTNDRGQYAFPRSRLEPGSYSITIRAAGYELPDPARISITEAQIPP